ncbi:MAG: helix-turn-helix transcriptional regulator, partial [Abitibacteriaceae bacterium]|nr:helix-turn-helix transcriptional regulator [Abditibacteriaceae bacterium]
VQQPRTLELESLLDALTATPQERQQALVLLNTPQARAQIRETIVQIEERKSLGPMPHGGALVRALRLRQGLTQEDAAKRIGVAVRTLRRWEKLEAWPETSQLHTLCYALEATTEEMLALTTGYLSPLADVGTVTLDELRAQGHHVNFYTNSWETPAWKELCLLTLEAQAWPLVASSGKGQQVLAELYSYHARHLSSNKRYAESGIYAARAMDLWPQGIRPNEIMVEASIALARAVAKRGIRPAPEQGLELLHHWQGEARGPAYQAWMLSELAIYTVQTGNETEGLQLAQRAREIATRCSNHHELYNRELDGARLLLNVKQPRQALNLIQQPHPHPTRDEAARFALLETEAYLNLEEPALAHDRLQHAWQMIEREAMLHLQPQAQALALRF